MRRRPPRSTRTDTLFPYTTLFRSFCSDGDFALAGGRFDAGDQPWARHVDLAPVWRRGHSRELGASGHGLSRPLDGGVVLAVLLHPTVARQSRHSTWFNRASV